MKQVLSFIYAVEGTICRSFFAIAFITGMRLGGQTALNLNAGAIFYLVDTTRTLSDGAHLAHELIREGRALRKLAEWATVQADAGGRGLRRFKAAADRAGLGPAVAAGLKSG